MYIYISFNRKAFIDFIPCSVDDVRICNIKGARAQTVGLKSTYLKI